MSTKEEFEIDLERGPEVLPLQRLNTGEFNKLLEKKRIEDSRGIFEEKLRKEYENESPETFFEKGPPERRKKEEEDREKMEREGMLERDPIGRREEYFEAEMEPWGEKGGRKRTHRKRHSKRKTHKKHRKTSRKHKKRSSKRSTKRSRK